MIYKLILNDIFYKQMKENKDAKYHNVKKVSKTCVRSISLGSHLAGFKSQEQIVMFF